VLEVETTEPALQLYTGTGVNGVMGKGAHSYGPYAALALETQHFPNSPNEPSFPSTILRPGQAYASRTVYRFLIAPSS
jgi:aldose 1-epimerase